jgi:hypothetical protein
MGKSAKLKASRDANLALYGEYNKTLRSWLVAFGIAVPAVFVASKDAKEFLLKAPDLELIIIVFLAGVAGQVATSFLNKFISWSAYHRDDCRLTQGRDCHPIFGRIASLENEIWIDFIFDAVTVGCFIWAVIRLLSINTAGA